MDKIYALAAAAEETAARLMPLLGVNKKREIARLIFEIAKRDNLTPAAVLPQEQTKNFEQAKNFLLAKRYPHGVAKTPQNAYYLPKLDLRAAPHAVLEQSPFYPKEILIEEAAQNMPLALRVRELFSLAVFKKYDKKLLAGRGGYSARKDTLVIIKENFDFIKPCPCSKNCFCCGYNLINLGFGCLYECNYCFLQQYQNLHAIVLPANIKDFLVRLGGAKLNSGLFPYARIGSGEFTDSLLFDDITGYSRDIVNFFRGRPEYFEFKTKSINIGGLLKQPAAPNIVAGWSVNPQNIIDSTEPLTPPLKARLAAAAKTAAHGYKTAFHFDPVILHPGWRENYKKVIEEIENAVPKESIPWISIGTIRFNRELKKVIESRFPRNIILDEEFLLGFDGKMRYAAERRREVYDYMGALLKQKFPAAVIYMCMETQAV
jgi:spore photoproduct lyase